MQDAGWRCLWEAKAHIGESTIWDERDGCIYWVDIDEASPSVNWYNLANGQKRSWSPPIWVSAIAPRAQGGFIASTASGLAFIDPAKAEFDLFSDPRSDPATTRLNDGVTDRKGRYWTGSCDKSQVRASTSTEDKEDSLGSFTGKMSGELFRIDAANNFTRVEDGLVTSNGPAFSTDGKTLYLNDTMPRKTWAYDLSEDGAISNRRLFLEYGPGDGFPDGITVDAEGGIWIAFYEGWELRRYSPDGTLLGARKLPVRQGLRPAFGGQDYSRLFLMTGSIAMSEDAKKEQPLAGSLFEILDPGVRGVPNVPFSG
jgi:sugar lactone lactonase YvrE